jgi:hypothetical protein
MQKNLLGLLYNLDVKNFQVDLRTAQDINNVIARMGTEIFHSRQEVARTIVLGSEYLLVVRGCSGQDSISIVSLKDLKLYAKIKYTFYLFHILSK